MPNRAPFLNDRTQIVGVDRPVDPIKGTPPRANNNCKINRGRAPVDMGIIKEPGCLRLPFGRSRGRSAFCLFPVAIEPGGKMFARYRLDDFIAPCILKYNNILAEGENL